MPDETDNKQPIAFKVQPPNQPVPEAIAKSTFSVEDYDPVQLPEHKGPESVVNDPAVKPEDKKKDETVAKKPDEKKSVEKTDDKTVAKKDEKVEKTDDKTDDKKEEKKLPGFLKPPADKKTEKKDEKVEGKKEEKIEQVRPTARDYSGYSAEQTAVLKQMSNEGFALTSRLIKENKELAKTKDSLFLQDPNAYVLDPQFRQMQSDKYFSQVEGDIWKQQLALIKAGKKFTPLKEFDKNGNPVYGAEMEPNDELEEEVRGLMNNSYAQVNQIAGKLQDYPTRYKQQIANDLQAIEQECSKSFAWVTNESLLDYSMHIEGLGDQTIREIRDGFVSLFPPYLQSNPGVKVAAHLFVALRYANAELAEARSSLKVDEIKEQERLRAEPTSEHREQQKSGKAVHGVTEFSDDIVKL